MDWSNFINKEDIMPILKYAGILVAWWLGKKIMKNFLPIFKMTNRKPWK